MEPRFHRALGALVLLALLVLSGVAALLGDAQAPTRQLTGVGTNWAGPHALVAGPSPAVRLDGTEAVRRDICLDAPPALDKTLVVGVVRASDSAPIRNATPEVASLPAHQAAAGALPRP